MAHSQYLYGGAASRRGAAELAKLRWEEPFDTFAFNHMPEERLATRLGARDIVLDLGCSIAGPFGEPIARLQVPGWMFRGDPADAEVVDLCAANGTISFSFGPLRLTYDRFGLRSTAPTRPAEEADG